MTGPQRAAGEQVRTLAVAAMGTVLVLIAYTTPVATLASTASGLGAGPAGQAWILSSMSCGLAVGLLPAGAIGDDYGRRRMFAAGAVLLFATASSLAYAQGTSSVACPDQQMIASAAGTIANPPQKTESESVGANGPSWQAQKAGFAVPCKK